MLVKGLVAEAVIYYRQALQLKPDYVEALCNLGNALRGQGKFDECVATFQQALAVRPDFLEALYSLGFVHHEHGNMEDALANFHKALSIQPNKRFRALFATMLAPVYQSSTEITAWRSRLTDGVRELRAEKFSLDITNETAFPTFRLAYQGLNDRELQHEIAQLFAPPREPARPVQSPRAKQDKIKIGFISKHFLRHPIGRVMRGLMAHLSRDDFEVTLLSVGEHRDDLARLMRQEANKYVVVPPNLPAARRVIADQALDVLFYTDIGIDPVTYSLAFSRLAPVQCVTWGHPVTTGIPAIDYFISSEQLETAQADQHYTEKLVRLKNLAAYYHRPELPGKLKTRGELGLPEAGTIYACPHMLFKLHPDFDALLAEVLRRDPQGTLVLIEATHPNWTKRLRQRLERTMADVAERIRFLPLMDQDGSMSLYAATDVLLDPIHFGDLKTSFEGLSVGTPIVTLPSEFLRSRMTYALYQQMAVLDCVVGSAEEYVDLAVRLGTDADFRAGVRGRIAGASDVLFENSLGVRDLEEFLRSVVQR